MPSCAILTCENESKTKNSAHGGVSYHRFPKNRTIKKEWIKATGRENWKPSKSSTICSDHFDKKKIQISKKGYKYLNDKDKVIPIKKIIILKDQNEKQKDAENDAFANKAPSKKLPKNELEKVKGAAAVKPEPSKALAPNEEGKSGPSKNRLQKEDGAPTAQPGPSKKRPQKEAGAPVAQPGPSKKRPQKEEEAPAAQLGTFKKRPQNEEEAQAAQPGPSKKRPLKEGEQEEGPAAKKACQDKDPDPNQNPPKMSSKEKLFKLLRWSHDKIGKQHLKIRSLQTVNRNLTHNVRIIEEFVKLLDEKITMTNEDLFNLKMTLT